ncbi:MAG: GTPase ObgE [Pirellulales bacterium]|nr:GTPase ObgE [Pirellulales bacterium]
MFVDEVVIEVEAGRGGDGLMSFRREKYVPRGGPDGGDGGDGGSVVVVAEAGVDSLAALAHRKHWKAKSGTRGGSSQCHGASAEDLVLRVPPGTLIRDAQEGFVLKDLTDPGDRVVVAHGGKGGKGNAHFKSSTNRAPRTVTPGGSGERRMLRFELKVIADVGLVGKPNAGKSTMLSRLTRARPDIAAYPFTTKYPNLGRVQIDYDRSFIMADIPGLIEGAHAGVGLGHEFLKHIQRAGILVHLVEPAPNDGTDPITNYRTIRDELEKYDVELVRRPEVVAVTKADLPSAEPVRQELAERLGREVLLISAVTGQGLQTLVARVARELQEMASGVQAEGEGEGGGDGVME